MDRNIYIILLVAIIITVGLGIYVLEKPYLKTKGQKEYEINHTTNIPKTTEKFCGISLKDSCDSDSDCAPGGCSLQICGNISDVKNLMSTCEYKKCYDAKKYHMKCSCVEGKCMWVSIQNESLYP